MNADRTASGKGAGTSSPRMLMFLCWLAYTAAYLGRYRYNSNQPHHHQGEFPFVRNGEQGDQADEDGLDGIIEEPERDNELFPAGEPLEQQGENTWSTLNRNGIMAAVPTNVSSACIKSSRPVQKPEAIRWEMMFAL